jgi:predicted GIY-YIG superfamily endonuclease
MKMIGILMISLVVMMSSSAFAQSEITREQFAEIHQHGDASRNQIRQIVESLCNEHNVEDREKKIDEYMRSQYDKDLFDCYYEVAKKYLTVDDYKYYVGRKNDPAIRLASEHQAKLKKMTIDSMAVFIDLAEQVISDGQSTVVEYECPKSYRAKWEKYNSENDAIRKSVFSLIKQTTGSNMDEDEMIQIFIPCVSAKVCNWAYKILTEKDLDIFIKEKKSPSHQHIMQYRQAMVKSPDDNIGTAIMKKIMAYFGIEE